MRGRPRPASGAHLAANPRGPVGALKTLAGARIAVPGPTFVLRAGTWPAADLVRAVVLAVAVLVVAGCTQFAQRTDLQRLAFTSGPLPAHICKKAERTFVVSFLSLS